MSSKRNANNKVFFNMNAAETYFFTKFGENVEENRKDHGLTQSDVYERTGIKPQHLSKIENGKVRVNAFDYVILQKLLQFDFSNAIYFNFSEDKKMEFTNDTDTTIISRNKLRLISFIIAHLNDDICEKLYLFLKEYNKREEK